MLYARFMFSTSPNENASHWRGAKHCAGSKFAPHFV
jgi:hypothetical protein